jgi:hypothetical protein
MKQSMETDVVRFGFGNRLDKFQLEISFSKQYSKKYILQCVIGTILGIAKHEGITEEEFIQAIKAYKGNVQMGDS